jgi:hypothetical protein
MTYNTIYHWRALDEIKQGKTVYILDKGNREVYCLNSMKVESALMMLEEAEKEASRFEIWKEEKDNA